MPLVYAEPQIPDANRYPVGVAAQILGYRSKRSIYCLIESGEIKIHKRRTGRMAYFITGAEIKRFWRSKLM